MCDSNSPFEQSIDPEVSSLDKVGAHVVNDDYFETPETQAAEVITNITSFFTSFESFEEGGDTTCATEFPSQISVYEEIIEFDGAEIYVQEISESICRIRSLLNLFPQELYKTLIEDSVELSLIGELTEEKGSRTQPHLEDSGYSNELSEDAAYIVSQPVNILFDSYDYIYTKALGVEIVKLFLEKLNKESVPTMSIFHQCEEEGYNTHNFDIGEKSTMKHRKRRRCESAEKYEENLSFTFEDNLLYNDAADEISGELNSILALFKIITFTSSDVLERRNKLKCIIKQVIVKLSEKNNGVERDGALIYHYLINFYTRVASMREMR